MAGPSPLVTIVCPAYDEEEVLPIFHEHLCNVLAELQTRFRFEILFVDDGSADQTLQVLQSLADRDARVGYLSLSRNFGHQAALTAGLESARGDAVISMDADLQHPPALIGEMLHQWQLGHDVVITIRGDDLRVGWFKRLSSGAFYWVMRALSDTEVRVAAADFRLLSRTALNALLQMKEQHRFVRGMVQWLGFRVTECPFQPEERQAGKSKYTLRRMLRLASDGLFSFSRVPLRAPMWGSGVFFAAALVHAALAISSGLQASGTAGWNYLMLVLHLGIGSVLASLGIVGEYVGRVHEQGKQRPVYLLKDCRLAALDHVHQRRDAA